ncbi:hypothetical protein D9M68_529930 [compost metagenome]
MAGFHQLHGELDPGGAAAHDHQVQPGRRIAYLGQIHLRHHLKHGQAELFRVFGGVQRDGVLGSAGRIEEVGGAAQGQHQGVVGEFAAGQDLVALRVAHRIQRDLAAVAVYGLEAALRERKPVHVGQHQVGQAFLVDIQCAGRRFVQRRLPDMEGAAVDQGDVLPPVDAAQLGSQFQAAGAAADDDNAFRGVRRRSRHHGFQYK